jgi:uncharacterized protein YjbI with pentapeptide repeats
MKEAWLSGARLVGAWLQGAKLNGATFSAARLQGQDWPAANLKGADLWDADLSGDDSAWVGVELYKANLRGVTGLTCAKLVQTLNWRATYRDVTFQCGADIPEAPYTLRCEVLEEE